MVWRSLVSSKTVNETPVSSTDRCSRTAPGDDEQCRPTHISFITMPYQTISLLVKRLISGQKRRSVFVPSIGGFFQRESFDCSTMRQEWPRSTTRHAGASSLEKAAAALVS